MDSELQDRKRPSRRELRSQGMISSAGYGGREQINARAWTVAKGSGRARARARAYTCARTYARTYARTHAFTHMYGRFGRGPAPANGISPPCRGWVAIATPRHATYTRAVESRTHVHVRRSRFVSVGGRRGWVERVPRGG